MVKKVPPKTRTKVKNPSSNKLPVGVTKKAFDEAIDRSGYPLQTVAAQIFEKLGFSLQHEWGYIDPNENKTRNADLMARHLFISREEYTKVRTRPALNVLVECKKTESPYVFFENDTNPVHTDFPLHAGLRSKEIELQTNDSRSNYIVSPFDCTGLNEHDFVKSGAPTSLTLAKLEMKGKKHNLSGDEPYNSLIHPLISAMRAYEKIVTSTTRQRYCDLTLVIGLAVVEGPMMLVKVKNKSHTSKAVPWVRMFRHEPVVGVGDLTHDKMIYGIDVVHIDFLENYLSMHLKPFANIWSREVAKRDTVFVDGQGFHPDLEKHWPKALTQVTSR